MIESKVKWPNGAEPMRGRPYLDFDGIVEDFKVNGQQGVALVKMTNGNFVTIPVMIQMTPATQEEIDELHKQAKKVRDLVLQALPKYFRYSDRDRAGSEVASAE